MSTNNTNSDWNINSDIYNIVDSVKNVQQRYIEDENETTLSLGIFGFTADVEAKKIQTSIIMAGQLGNEMFPTRALLTKNVLTSAAYAGITDFNAIPAKITVTICIKTEDIAKYIDENGCFYLDAKCPIFIEDYEFHLDYDVRIKRKLAKEKYTYSAQYVMEDENGNKIVNGLSDITNPYLSQPFLLNIGNFPYLGIQCTLRQCSIEEIDDNLISDSIIENRTYSFDFDNQLADFRVVVTDNGKEIEFTPYMEGFTPDSDTDYYCYYLYTGDNTIRIRFDSASYIPGLNAKIYIKIYNTLGKSGEFEYLDIDQTSEGLYVDISSEEYDYSNITTYIVAVTDSSDGSDRKSVEELKKLIPKAGMARGSITTDTDIYNYFNLINTDTNKVVTKKKEDNQINRTWYAYFLLKDDNNNIIPTNTIKVKMNLADSDHVIKCDDGRYIIPAGTHFRYDSVNEIAEPIDESKVPIIYTDAYFSSGYYYYINPYNIVLSKDPLYASYYLSACNYDSYFTYDYVNQNCDIQFVANRFHFSRKLLTDLPIYKMQFNIAQSVNDGEFLLISTERISRNIGTSTIVEDITTENGKVILVLYKDGIPYRWKECTYDHTASSPESAIYNFYVNIYSASEFDNDNCIKITGMNEAGSTASVYGYIPENCEAKIYVLANIKFDTTVEYPRKDLDNIAPGYEDYTVTNIYSCVSGITFFDNVTDVTKTKVEAISNSAFNIDGVPMIGKHYLMSEDEASFVLEALRERKSYIDYCISLVENNMNIDFKFFNTYGKTKTYTLEDESTYIGHIDINIKFKLSLKDNSDISVVDQINNDIKNYIEDINNIADWHAPNLITQITNTYKDRINFFEFVGFNEFGADDQHIILVDNDDPAVVPEFINIRNVIDNETNTLVPCIDIELV